MDEIFVSVVMPMYNTNKEQLKLAIESILNQTYKNFELIIIDDYSTNDCCEVVLEYQKIDNRIVLLKNEKNLGIEQTLNKGIEFAKSEYIVRMDSDDIAYLDRIEKQILFMKENPQYDFIGGRADFFNESGIFRETKFYGPVKNKNFVLGTPFIHPSMVIKKAALDSIGRYPISYRTEDYLMQMMLIAKGYKGYIMEDKVLKYRQDIDNIKRLSKKQRIAEIKVKLTGFKMMKLPFFYYIFLLKPIIAIFIPVGLMNYYQKRKK